MVKNLIRKELVLSTPSITWWFLAFGLMTLIPGYPILMGAFFVCFGIFRSFQYAREADDILYSALLPIRKRDVVKGKYLAIVLIQILGFAIMIMMTILRMTVMADAEVYKVNVLMAANLTFLAFVLLIFAAFNWIFVKGFFRTAYYFGKPLVAFIVAATLLVTVAETLHHLPGLAFLNEVNGNAVLFQAVLLAASIAIYVIITLLSMRQSQRRFEALDL